MSSVLVPIELGAVTILFVGWLLRETIREWRFRREFRDVDRTIPRALLPTGRGGTLVVNAAPDDEGQR